MGEFILREHLECYTVSPTEALPTITIIPIAVATDITVSKEGFSGKHARILGSGRSPSVCPTGAFPSHLIAICARPSPPQGPRKEEEELEIVLLSLLLPHNWSWEETWPSFGLGIR